MKNQYMPMFWGDFLANTMDLSAQELGAYVLLIAHAWEHDACVPYDTAQRIARVNNFHWAKVKARLEPFFEVRDDPCCSAVDVVHRMYYHDKVHRVLTSAAEISNKRKAAALQMHSKSRANGHANGHANGVHLNYTNNKDASLGKGSSEKPFSPPDDATYRSPPRAKSDNPLMPLPERLLAK